MLLGDVKEATVKTKPRRQSPHLSFKLLNNGEKPYQLVYLRREEKIGEQGFPPGNLITDN